MECKNANNRIDELMENQFIYAASRPLKVGLDLFLERQSCPLREVKKDTVV